jgi:hypothetical protein
LIGLFALTGSASAHHSVLPFDGTRPVELTGVVRQVVWGNPHVYVAVDAGAALDERWIVEVESPLVLVRLGWSRTSLSVGDRVRTVGAPSRAGARVMRCEFVVPAGGSALACFPGSGMRDVSSKKDSRPHYGSGRAGR